LLLSICDSVVSAGPTLDVQQTLWGFDGQVVSDRFNLLSVLVSNPSPQPFDGRLVLKKTVGTLRVDAPYVQTVYIAPHSSRWVQFHPFTKYGWEDWSLSWGSGSAEQVTLPQPRHGPQACVLLDDQDPLSSGGGAIKRFPENLFPASLTATDCLRSVVLDHVPRWEEARQRAFLDWVNNGGTLHLVKDSRGEFPRFAGILESLNLAQARGQVGMGRVYRHDRDRRQLDPTFVETVIVAERDPNDEFASLAGGPLARERRTRDGGIAQDQFFSSHFWDGDSTLLTALKKMSRPEHNWVLIHLLSLTYIALVYPGCYLIGRRRGGDYRVVFGTLIGTVAAFSLIFLVVGRRGYGERTVINSVALARTLLDGRYDVTQWSNAFVVDGGDYTFAHEGTGRLYSSCQDEEAVRGEIVQGAEARFTADMPPYSSRAFGHRLLASGPAITARVVHWASSIAIEQVPATLRDATSAPSTRRGRILNKLVLAKGEDFPKEYEQVHCLFDRRVYRLADKGDRFELSAEAGTLPAFLKLDQQNQFQQFYNDWSELEGTPRQLYQSLHLPLVARACDLVSHRDLHEFALPEGCLRLLVYAPMPAEFFAKDARFDAQRGMVLYCLDLFPGPPTQ
jgi:hypothetical protein